MHVYEVLKRPIVTEKSGSQADKQSQYNQYTFQVDLRANKIQIKKAVEVAFDVRVVAVNVMNVPGKTRRWGRHLSKTPVWKKAVVSLAPGDRIELYEGV